MKKLFALLTIAILIASCNKESAVLEQDNSSKMLESYIIKRNANGSYTLSHQVSEGVATNYVDNDKLSEVQLYYSNQAQSTQYSHEYNVVNNELQIKFVTQNNEKHSRIRIIDNNTTDFNGKESLGLLRDYNISENANGSYQLNFEVESGVAVNYDFDADQNINNIRLSNDVNSVQTAYSVSYSKDANGILKIDFVQPASDKSASSDMRKPRVIMDTTSDDFE